MFVPKSLSTSKERKGRLPGAPFVSSCTYMAPRTLSLVSVLPATY